PRKRVSAYHPRPEIAWQSLIRPQFADGKVQAVLNLRIPQVYRAHQPIHLQDACLRRLGMPGIIQPESLGCIGNLQEFSCEILPSGGPRLWSLGGGGFPLGLGSRDER
ncbi:MAG: hypothetical protein JWQ62_626, partial [Lacunisphaera sp.]|nr:hypothetical protein [Lacunisphaera sp.]